MTLIAKKTGGGDFTPLPAGTHTAICYSVVDLGTHHSDFFNKDVHQLLLQWEIPEERIDLDRDGKKMNLPRAISKRFTLSLHEKSALRQALEVWRGRAFTEQELEGFDVGKIAGAACLLGVIQEVGKDGKTYAKVSSIMALPKVRGKRQAMQPENPITVFSIPDNPEPGFDIPATLPEWIVKTIQESNEWKGIGREPPPQAQEVACEIVDEAPPDDLPF